MILAGDIGGTSTRMGIFEATGERISPVIEQVYSSREHDSLDEIVAKFVSACAVSVTRASFGVAGPVKNGRSQTPNLPWVVDAQKLAAQLGIEKVGLLNDLEANAYGIAALEAKDFAVLSEGALDAVGNAAIISAGTGLGEAGLYWDGKQHRPFASEGGHADFAPRNELETELLRYMMTKIARVSYERVLSGPGLFNVYRFLRDTGRGIEPPWLAEEISKNDPSAVISRAALAEKSELCSQALDLFAALYGAEAGNLALRYVATGGVYVGGGIAPKIIDRLKRGAFMDAFVAKGRLAPLLEAIPVRVILNDKTALLGAARFATIYGK